MSQIFKKKSIEDFNLSEIKSDECLVFVDKDCNLSIIDGTTKEIQSFKQKMETITISGQKQINLNPQKYIFNGTGNISLSLNNWKNGDEAELFVDTNFIKVSYPSNWIIYGDDFKDVEKQYVLTIGKYQENIFIKIKFQQ